MSKRILPIKVVNVSNENISEQQDHVAVEEPLEIQLEFGLIKDRQRKSISITMRTPGHDIELAKGFLFTEGIIQSFDQIQSAEIVKQWNQYEEGNIVLVALVENITIDFQKLERHFYTSSSCGVCGKSSIDAVSINAKIDLPTLKPLFKINKVHHFPKVLRELQTIFETTGGLHAAALFDTNGNLKLLREDVGRHNAVDKLIGAALVENRLPLFNSIIVVSGRASFELIQKSLMAGIPMLVAVGAPSSLAIELAEENNMTVIGFTRNQKYNIYCHPERINRFVSTAH